MTADPRFDPAQNPRDPSVNPKGPVQDPSTNPKDPSIKEIKQF